MKLTNDQLKLAANTVRCLCVDMIEKANSGHPGAPLGMADLAVSLWLKYLNVDPQDTKWAGRDRLVFSGGHASSLVYALFHLAGTAGLTMDELKKKIVYQLGLCAEQSGDLEKAYAYYKDVYSTDVTFADLNTRMLDVAAKLKSAKP